MKRRTPFLLALACMVALVGASGATGCDNGVVSPTNPDLIAVAIALVTGNYGVGDPLPITRDYSEGAGVAAGAFAIRYVLSTDQTYDAGLDTEIAVENVAGLAASQAVSGALAPVPNAPAVTAGNYYVGMFVDYLTAVTEGNETNNIAFTTNTVWVAPPITGTVTDNATALPIQGAQLSTPAGDTALTDAAGNYTLVPTTAAPWDVQAMASGYLGQTQLAVAIPPVNFALVRPTNVLIYYWNSPAIDYDTTSMYALDMMGIPYTAESVAANYEAQLISGTPWDLIIHDQPQFGPTTAQLNALSVAAQAGGRVIFYSWSFPAHQLWTDLGITQPTGVATANELHPWDPAHPLCAFPNTWPVANNWIDPAGFGTLSANTTLNGGSAVAGSVAAITPGAEQIIHNNSGRTIFFGNIPGNAIAIATPHPDMLLYYQFNEAAGTTAANLGSVGPANATWVNVTGNPTWAAGQLNNAVGIGDNGRFGSGWATNIPGDFTLEFWFTKTTTNAAYACGDGTLNSFRVYSVNTYISLRGAGLGTHNTVATINDSAWHHVAWAYDASAQTTTCYVDGAFDSVVNGQTATLTGGTEFLLGTYNVATGSEWEDSLDDFRLWNRALSAGRIAHHYQAEIDRYALDNDTDTLADAYELWDNMITFTLGN